MRWPQKSDDESSCAYVARPFQVMIHKTADETRDTRYKRSIWRSDAAVVNAPLFDMNPKARGGSMGDETDL